MPVKPVPDPTNEVAVTVPVTPTSPVTFKAELGLTVNMPTLLFTLSTYKVPPVTVKADVGLVVPMPTLLKKYPVTPKILFHHPLELCPKFKVLFVVGTREVETFTLFNVTFPIPAWNLCLS